MVKGIKNTTAKDAAKSLMAIRRLSSRGDQQKAFDLAKSSGLSDKDIKELCADNASFKERWLQG